MIAPNKKNNINDNADTRVKVNFFSKLIWYLFFILIIPIIIHIVNLNSIKRIEVKVNEAESGIDVQLKRRRDTLLKLMESVEGIINFEKETLTQITNMRMGGGVPEMIKNNKIMDKASRDFMIQVENYPNLKSSEVIQTMMDSINDIEENIAASRRIYNSNVSIFNQKIVAWPANVAASLMKAKIKYFFEITEEDRQDVEIKF
ncbi:LemA family protein [Spiroplasma taiwanense]|uniref:LemA family protein n=1 Tax=Spiroplasma taiwanense CT-1 TaxID=1276220 RepID=S5MAG5_9MOLU|nr:LemA family protein [Spiroplasma taiwanense]AGR40743.1 LemA family protein [Spiroplasma taiwanense CT-1]